MRSNATILGVAALLALVIEEGHAGPVGPLTTFTAGTQAKASEVNGNFGAVATAVNDNDSRITVIESRVTPDGNVVLVPSTATTGKILKGTFPFIHDFGAFNTFIGVSAGNFTMTGGDNTASGAGALQSNTTGNFNSASGAFALQLNTSGGGNSASGAFALLNNQTGSSNTASGLSALRSNTMGNSNTSVGAGALFSNMTGSFNIAIGLNAGANLTTGDSNIDIGNLGVAGESHTIRIGSLGVQAATFIAGIRGVTTGGAAIPVLVDTNGQLGTTSSSRRVKDDIADMGKASRVLMKLRPVTFHYKNDKNPKGRTLQYGLVAEEVAKVAPSLVAHSADGKIETVYYQFLAPMLLSEYQKQQRTIEAQASELTKQRLEIAELRRQAARIAELERQSARTAAVLARLEPAAMIATAGQ